MKKKLLKSALIALAGVGLLVGNAMAIQMTITTDDGTPFTTTISDTDGDVSYSNSNFDGWNIIATAGFSETAPPLLNMTSIDAIKTEGATSLSILVTETFSGGNYDHFLTILNSSMNTITNPTTNFVVTISDGTTTTPFTIGAIPLGTTSQLLDTTAFDFSGDWTLSMLATISGTGKGTISFDGTTNAVVPEPATMLLFGTGLAGLAGIARRKKANKA